MELTQENVNSENNEMKKATNPIINKNTNKTSTKKANTKSYTVYVKNYDELTSEFKKATNSSYDTYIINLKKGNYYAKKDIYITESFTKNIIINGNGSKINGKYITEPYVAVIRLTSEDNSGTIKINDLEFNNYSNNELFSCDYETSPNLKFFLNNVVFSNNKVYTLISEFGTMYANNVSFVNNHLLTPVMLEYTHNLRVYINNCLFKNNFLNGKYYDGYEKGILVVSLPSIINNTKFINNTVYDSMIYSLDNLNITNSLFQNNHNILSEEWSGKLVSLKGYANLKNNKFDGNFSNEIEYTHCEITVRNNTFNKTKINNLKITGTGILTNFIVYDAYSYSPPDLCLGDKIILEGCLWGRYDFKKDTHIPIKSQNVTIKINNKKYNMITNSKGEFKISYKSYILGKNNVTVTYAGNKNYTSCRCSDYFTVKRPANIIINKIKTAMIGQQTKISGKLLSDGKPLKNSKVSISINNDYFIVKTSKTGYFYINYNVSSFTTKQVSVDYYGSKTYMYSHNETTFKVKQKTKLTILTNNTVPSGKKVKISGKLRLTKNNKGVKGVNVTIILGNKKYTVKTSTTGYFTINHVFDKTKTKVPIKFTFNGSTLYLASNKSSSLTII